MMSRIRGCFFLLLLSCTAGFVLSVHYGRQVQQERAANAEATRIAQQSNTYCPPENQRPNTLAFTGRVSDEFNDVPNHYLVLLYRGNEEVGRAETASGQHTYLDTVQDTTDDGYYEIRVANTLRVAPCDFNAADFYLHQRLGNNSFVNWMEEVPINEAVPFEIPDKNFRYVLWVIPAPVPSAVKDNPTQLTNRGIVAVPEGTELPIDLVDLGVNLTITEADEFEYEIIPGSIKSFAADNCAGENTLFQRYHHRDTFAREFDFGTALQSNVSGSLGSILAMLRFPGIASFEASVNAALQANLNINSNLLEETEVLMELEFPAGQYLRYELFRQIIWRPATVTLDFEANSTPQTYEMTFRTKMGLEVISRSSELECA